MNCPADSDRGDTPVCARCGESIDDREPAWLENADGELHPSSLWNLDGAARRRARRVWHVACYAAEHYAADGDH